MELPIISPFQIDKQSSRNENDPSVEDAKGSTSIGHESDVSLRLIHEDRLKPEMMLWITKNRRGEYGYTRLHFDRKTLSMRETYDTTPNTQTPPFSVN